MRHPVDGVLRRLVDEPAGVAEPYRRHVAGCARCQESLAAVRIDATAAASLLAGSTGSTGSTDSTDSTGSDTDAAWQRFTATAGPRPGWAGAGRARGTGRVGRALRRPGVAALAVTVVVAGAGTAAAADWLTIFRTEEVAPLSFSTADLVALPDPSAFGDAVVVDEPEVRPVADAAAAEAATGLDVPEVTALPSGVTGEPRYQVGDEAGVSFTFSAERVAEAAAAAGRSAPTLPPGLDGSQVRLQAGPGVAGTWASASGVPALVVARVVAPTASSSGASFETVRDYVLSLPGLPDDVAAQLATFAADGSTLPIPVPQEQATTSTADVDGVPATVVVATDRTVAAVVWVSDGVVTVVAGSLDADELLDVARGLAG